MPRPALVLGLALAACSPASAEPPKPVSFAREVRPLLAQHCQGCHQPAKMQGGYKLTDYASLLKAGESERPAVVPGKPGESYLIEEITAHDGRAEMPKGREPLKPSEVELVARWVREGAPDDSPQSASRAEFDAEHPPRYTAPPVVTSLAYSPDGSLLAVSGYHEVLLRDARTYSLAGRLVGLSERVQSLAFSPDGSRLAVAGGNPGRLGEVQVWDVAKRALKLSAPATLDTVYGVSWSPDGRLIAFGGADNAVRALDAATGRQVLQMGTHSDWVLGTAFSQDGQHVASVSRDMSMKLTEVATARFIDNVTSITPGALKGGLLAVDRRPAKPGRVAKPSPDMPNAAPRPYDELLCAGADGRPRLYKMHREVKRVIGDDANKLAEFAPMPGRVARVAFDPDGQRFVAVSSLDGAGAARVYTVEGGKSVDAKITPGPLYAAAWRPDGKAVAVAGFSGTVFVIDPASGDALAEFPAAPPSK